VTEFDLLHYLFNALHTKAAEVAALLKPPAREIQPAELHSDAECIGLSALLIGQTA